MAYDPSEFSSAPPAAFSPDDFTNSPTVRFAPSDFTATPPPPKPDSDGPTPDTEGITDEIAGVGRALARGGRRFVQQGDIIGMRRPAELESQLATAREDLAKFDQGFSGKPPSPVGTRWRNDQLGKIGALEAEMVRYQKMAPELAKSFGRQQEAIEALPPTQAEAEFRKPESGFAKFFENPVELAATAIAESLPSMAVGMLGAPLGPVGLAASVGASSSSAESAGRVTAAMQKAGVDLQEPQQVLAWFANKAKSQPEIAKADLAALGPGAFDALTAGFAGRILGPLIGKGIGKVAAGTAGEVGMQATGGAAGSIAGSTLAGEEIDWKDALLEGIIEIFSGPFEAVSNIRGESRLRPLRNESNRLRKETPNEEESKSTVTTSAAPATKGAQATTETVAPSAAAAEAVNAEAQAKAEEAQAKAAAEAQAAATGTGASTGGKIPRGPSSAISAAAAPPLDVAGSATAATADTARELDILETLEEEKALTKKQKKRLQELRAAAPAPPPPISEPPAAPVGEEPTRAAGGTQPPVVVTAPESQSAASTLTPEQIQAELAEVTEQLAAWPALPATTTPAERMASLEAKTKLAQRGSFLREAAGIQAAAPKEEVPKVTKDKDFAMNGVWIVKIGDQTFRIFHDSESKTWYDVDEREAVRNPDATTGIVSQLNKADAIEQLQRRVSSKPKEVLGKAGAAATPPTAVAPVASPTPNRSASIRDIAKQTVGELKPAPISRSLDITADNAYGPAFQLGLGPMPEDTPVTWLKELLKGWSGAGKANLNKLLSKRTLVYRDTQTGELIEVSIRSDTASGIPKIVKSVSKAGKPTWTDAIPFLRTKSGETPRYVPVATMRYSEAQPGVRRAITQEELAKLDDEFKAQATGVAPVTTEQEADILRQPGVNVAEAKPKVPIAPVITPADATAIVDAVGRPQWEDEADGRDVILSALETTVNAQARGYLQSFMTWIRSNDLDTTEELAKFIGKVYESFERNKQAVVDGTLPPASYRAAVAEGISKAGPRGVQPRGEVQPAGESTGAEAGGDVSGTDAIEDFLTRAIEATDTDFSKLQGQVIPIWIPQTAANLALRATLGVYRVGRSAVRAIAAGLDSLRALPNFNEQEATAWLQSAISEEPAASTQVSGNAVGILSKVIAPSIEEQIDYSQKVLSEYGIPFERVDKIDPRIRPAAGAGPVVKTQFKFKPDGNNYDAQAVRLADELEAAIARGDQAGNLLLVNLTTSIANSVANGDASVVGADGRQMISDAIQQRLFNLAQTPASEAGQVLAMRGQSSFDPEGELQMARNVGVNLRNIWSKALGGEQIASVMDQLSKTFRSYFTPEIVSSVLAPLNLDARVVAVVSDLLAQPQPDISKLETEISVRLRREFAFSDEQADATARSIFRALESTFATATDNALKAVQSGLVGDQAKIFRRGGSLWEALRKAVKAGVFDPGAALEKMAKDLGYTIPSDAQKAQIKQLVEREEFLRTPTERQITSAGGDTVKATQSAEKATEIERLELIRKIQASWSRWSKPVRFLKWLSGNPEIARNNSKAINEFVASNLLSTLTFLFRQTVDVGLVSMPLNAVNRTLAHVLERASNDGGFSADTLADLNAATKEMLTSRLESLKSTARQAANTLRGGATRKVLERTTHSIGIFERMRLRADELEASGNKAAATAVRLATILKAGYRIAETGDTIQSVGTEWQEMKQQLSTELRKMGKTRAEIATQVDDIFNLSRLDVEQAKAEAAAIGAERGLVKSAKTLALDADALLKARAYDRMKEATGGRLDFQRENEVLRELHAWNLPETGGIGGVIAETIKTIKTKTERMGIPTGGLFSFGNAMGIAANRMATFSGGGLFGGWGFGDSPWYQGERNIRQRRIEAIQGLSAIALVTALAAAKLIVIQTKYPRDKDEKEKFIADGHKLNTIRFINDDGGWIEMPISMSPFSFIASPLYMIGGVQRLLSDQQRDQEKLNELAARTGGIAGTAKPVGFGDIMGVLAQGAYGMLTGGRTASGAIQSFSDYGEFKLNRAVASLVSPYIPALPAWNGVARMMGAAVDSRSATLMELLVPSPWSPHQRVNSLGDPLTNPNSGVRVLQVLSGGIGFGDEADAKSNRAYRQLFNAGFATPEIQPNKGYDFNGTIRPMQGDEIDHYAVARAKAFKEELEGVDTDGLPEDEARKVVQQAFSRANERALTEVGVTSSAGRRSTSAGGGGRASSSSGPRARAATSLPRLPSVTSGGGSRLTAGLSAGGSRLGGYSGAASRGASRLRPSRPRGSRLSSRTRTRAPRFRRGSTRPRGFRRSRLAVR